MSAKIKVVCPTCGSDDVTRDGILSWDIPTQEWVVVGEYDDMTCNECGYEGHSFDEKTVEEETNG